MFHIARGEKGFTLVELLATILLLGIVITISSMLLIQVIGNEEKTNETISLEQETNVLISELRSEAYKDKDTFCVDDSNFDLSVEEIIVLNPAAASYDPGSKCFTISDSEEPLAISLKTKNDGIDTTVQTVLNRKAEATFKIPEEETVVSEERIWFVVDELPCDLKSFNKSFNDIKSFRDQLVKQYANKGEVSNIFNSNQNQINKVTGLIEDQKNLSNITEKHLRTLNPKDVSFILNNDAIDCGNKPILLQGDGWKPSVWFPDQIDASKIDMHIGGNLYTTEQFGLKNNSSLQVDGNTEFAEQTDMDENNINIKIVGNMKVHNQMDIKNSAIVDIGGDMEAHGKVNLLGSGKLTIKGKADYDQQVKLSDSATLEISGNVTFKDQVEFQKRSVKATIQGNADFKDTVQIDSATVIIVHGNSTFKKQVTLASGAKLTVKKSAKFDEFDSVTLDGIFCAQKSSPHHKNSPSCPK